MFVTEKKRGPFPNSAKNSISGAYGSEPKNPKKEKVIERTKGFLPGGSEKELEYRPLGRLRRENKGFPEEKGNQRKFEGTLIAGVPAGSSLSYPVQVRERPQKKTGGKNSKAPKI